MGILSELASEYKGTGFQLIGLVGDVSPGDKNAISQATDVFKASDGSFTNLLLSDSVAATILSGVSVVPTTKFYDEDGVLLTTVVGAMGKQSWINLIETVIHEKA